MSLLLNHFLLNDKHDITHSAIGQVCLRILGFICSISIWISMIIYATASEYKRIQKKRNQCEFVLWVISFEMINGQQCMAVAAAFNEFFYCLYFVMLRDSLSLVSSSIWLWFDRDLKMEWIRFWCIRCQDATRDLWVIVRAALCCKYDIGTATATVLPLEE